MVEKVHRSSLDELEKDENQRRAIIMLLAALMIFLLIFACGQLAMMFGSSMVAGDASSRMSAEYGAWNWEGPFFGGLNPAIVAEAAKDGSLDLLLASSPAPSCFLLGACTPFPFVPTDTPTPTETPTTTSTPTKTPTPTNTPTVTNTLPPTFTFTPVYTATNTPTPTPLVYPIKLAFPQNIPPGSTTIAFDIIVINYGNPTGAQLTEVIDRLPAGMTYRLGSCNPGSCVASGGGSVLTWTFSPGINISQGSFYRLTFQADVFGTSPGDVLVNEVETQGGNFQTSVNWRPVYVYTATPTPTATVVPITSPDSATTDEDNAVDIDVLSNDGGLRDAPFTVTVIGPPTSGSTLVLGSPGPASGIRIRYTPNANFFGIDTFTYRVTDNDGQSATALVTVTVNSVDDIPSANPDVVTINEDTWISINILANDAGIGDPNFTVSVTAPPTNGSFIVVGSPGPASGIRIWYLGSANYFGPDSFTYQVTDSDLDSSSASVSVTVNPVNDPPVAVNDGGYSVDEDDSLDISVTGDPYVIDNDTDVDGPFPLSAVLRTNAINGAVALNADGSFTYTPNADFFGTDSFTYWVRDASALQSLNFGTVTLTVNGTDDTPVAVDDNISTDEDTPVSVNVLANDVTVVDLPVTVTILTGPSNGGVAPIVPVIASTFPPTATFTYTPSLDWNGVDTFEYEACDADLPAECSSAWVTITVNPVHDPPDAQPDSDTTLEDTPRTIAVLANDIAGDSPIDPATVSIVSGPPNGSITNIDSGTGNITYEPDPDYFGGDSFSYTVDDFAGYTSNVATVTIAVTADDDVPAAVADIEYALVGDTIDINVLANDLGIGDTPLLVTIETNPPGSCPLGTCVSVTASNRVRYTPDIAVVSPPFSGSETFSYRVTDTDGQWSVANITVYINDPPTANDDDLSTNEDVPITINVLADNGSGVDIDSDQALNPASVNITSPPSDGSVVNHFDGTVTYTPDLDFNSPTPDCFDYTVDDTYLPVPATSNSASVCITVNGVNDPPTAIIDSGFAQEDGSDIINVLANDFDIDGSLDPTTVSVVGGSGPSNGSTSVNPVSGVITYTPNGGFYGFDSFRYTVDDDLGDTSNEATVTVEVNARPIAVDDNVTANEDVSTIFDVLANDSDPDNSIFISGVTPAINGTVTNNGASISYNPNLDYNGPDLFSYTVADGRGGFDTAIVNVTVQPANDVPVANADPGNITNEDVPITLDVLANDTGLGDSPFTVTVISGPSLGSTSVIGSPGPAAGIRIQYTPNANLSGNDSFDYQVTDGNGDSSTATVSIQINAVNDPPVAVDDSDSTIEETPIDIDVLANDSDPVEGDLPLTILSVTQPPNGTVTNNGSDVTYNPAINFTGVDNFTYTVQDSGGATDTANVSVTVNPLPDPPIANNDSTNTNQANPVTINVAANDSDPDGDLDPNSVVLVGLPANGTAVNNFNGTVTYTPNAGDFTNDFFTYQIFDLGGLPSNIATVTVNINPPSLRVVKDAVPTTAFPGDAISFLVYIWNDGPGVAYNVSLTDTLGACFRWGTNPAGSIGTLAEGGAVVRIGSAFVRNPLPGSCVPGENINSVTVTSSNASSASDSVTISLPFGGGPPLMAPLGAAMSLPGPAPTSTPTPSDTPESLMMSMAAPMSGGAPMAFGALGVATQTPTLDPVMSPASAATATASGTPIPSITSAGEAPSETATTLPPSETPDPSGMPAETTIAPSETEDPSGLPTDTPVAALDTPVPPAQTTIADGTPHPTATLTDPITMAGVGPSASSTPDQASGEPAATSTPDQVSPTTGPSGGGPAVTPEPTPTPALGAPTTTEATFTLLIPLMMLIVPLLYAWYRRMHVARL